MRCKRHMYCHCQLTRPSYSVPLAGDEQQPTRLHHSTSGLGNFGKYSFSFQSAVQRCSEYNCFQGLVVLGGGYWIEVSTAGRKHAGSIAIQLLDRATHHPCGLEEWRVQAATIPCPVKRTAVMSVKSQAGKSHLGMAIDENSTRTRLHGVSLSIAMHGRSSLGKATLFHGPEPSIESSMRLWQVFVLE